MRLVVVWLVPMIAFAAPLAAQSQDLRARRQAMLSKVLTTESAQSIARERIACLSGRTAQSFPALRNAGAIELPDVADHCITVLIRSARNGATTPMRLATSAELTSASAIDNGFMQGFGQSSTLPSGLPSMEVLKPIAERCLAMQEANVKLCVAVGSAYGQRAAKGEIITVR